MRRMYEHVQQHGPSVGIIAPLPGRYVPGALQLLVRNLRQYCNNVVEGPMPTGVSSGDEACLFRAGSCIASQP